MEKLSSEYWSNRYQNNDTGWDLKKITPPIKSYVDQLTDTSISILIPGAGKGYEGEYLHKLGFHNVHILDFSKEPINSFQERVLSGAAPRTSAGPHCQAVFFLVRA